MTELGTGVAGLEWTGESGAAILYEGLIELKKISGTLCALGVISWRPTPAAATLPHALVLVKKTAAETDTLFSWI